MHWRTIVLTISCLLLAGFSRPAAAVTSYYWDINGTTTGAGGNGSPSGTWESANWTTGSNGRTATGNWVEGNFPRFCAGTDATGVYTVTANSSHTITGVYNTTAGSTILNGPGTLFISFPAGLAGFLVVDSLTVNNVLADSGGAAQIETEVSSGANLYLNGSNTFSGGTILGGLTGVGTVNFGNNSAFGTGLIQMQTSGGTLAAEGTGAYTIANAVSLANITQNIVGTPAGVTFTGAWDTGVAGPSTLSFNGSANNVVTIAGVISDAQGFVKTGVGILVLSGNNTYGSTGAPNGNTVVSGGTLVLANGTNGSATGSSKIVVANTAATLTGNGVTLGTVDNSGIISATNLSGGPATLTTGSQTWELGSIYQWAINNVTGSNGANPGWDQLTVNGGVTIAANSSNPLNINVTSLTAANMQGALAVFNNAQDYSWLVLHSSNSSIAGFSTSAVTVSSASFSNAIGSGIFSVSTNNGLSGGDLYVNFIHAPVLALSNITASPGSNAVFSASNTVPGSVPATAVYSWKSNNVPLADGGRIFGSSTPTLIIANVQASDAATYTVLASNPAGFSFVPATLTVLATSTSITWATPAPVSYGTPFDTNQLNATANVPGTFVYSPASGAVLRAGTNTLTAVFTPSDTVDYTSATNTVSLVVTPVPLTVTANSAVRPVGTANPAFSGVIVGLVNGDNITAVYNCSATTGSPAGAYPIVPSLVDPNNLATNYTVSLVNGTLSVGTVITWPTPSFIFYGTPLTTNQLNATADVPGTFVYSPALGTIFGTGNYTLTTVFTPNDTVNYTKATNSVNLAVSPAPLTVAGANVTRQAGTTNPVFTGSITGLQNGDVITATYSSTANSASAPGTYAIVPTVNDPNNYETNYSLTILNGTLTISPPPPPVTPGAPSIIPLPVLLQTNPGVFGLCPSQPSAAVPAHALIQIVTDAASHQTGQFLAATLFKSTGYQFQLVTGAATNAVKGTILITTANAISTLGAEGYELTVAPDSVVIRAPAQGGTFYGVQTLLQLLPPPIYSQHIVTNTAWVAPCVYVQDYPQFSWRGFMLDPARHFVNKQEVRGVLDAMAMHKLNVMHWHLVDDQAWCLEITNFPNLTAVGAFRSNIDYGLNPRASTATNAAGQYGGFYTQTDAREIVAYAAERHITVVPEIEMPCHSSCALNAYPQFGCGNPVGNYRKDYPNINYGNDLYSPGTPGTMAFLEEVLTEVMQIFPSKYIHCGGDEVVSSGDRQWNSYTPDVTNMEAQGITPNGSTSVVQYQHWFSTVLANFIQSKGRVMMGWTEFENGGIIPNAALTDWESGSSSQAAPVAMAGLPVVMSLSSVGYLDHVEGTGSGNLNVESPYAVGGVPQYLPLSTVYGFNPIPAGLAAQYTNNILGAQCTLFAEYVPSYRNVMFKMFPRETALAEITWTPTAAQNFASFTNRLVRQKQRFDQMGVNYDHESLPQAGTWGPTVSTSPTTSYYNITTNVTSAGEIDVNFWYLSGAKLSISSVALLVNGVQVDIDVHTGLAESSATYMAVEPFIPIFTLYVLHLPETKPGATYTIQTVTQGSGGTTASGIIYLPNWN